MFSKVLILSLLSLTVASSAMATQLIAECTSMGGGTHIPTISVTVTSRAQSAGLTYDVVERRLAILGHRPTWITTPMIGKLNLVARFGSDAYVGLYTPESDHQHVGLLVLSPGLTNAKSAVLAFDNSTEKISLSCGIRPQIANNQVQ